jgi:hypothetical protein
MVVDESPRDDHHADEPQADEEDPSPNNQRREYVIKKGQQNGRDPQGLEEADAQFDVASKGFQVIEVKVIEGKLNAGHNQYGFQNKVFILIETFGVPQKTEVGSEDHHSPDEKTLQEEEGYFAYGYVLVENSKDHQGRSVMG